MIAEESIEAVKSKMKVQEVVGDFVALKKEGADYVGLCPFHTEKTPSFKVSASKQIYKCFGCGKSGDAIQFLVEAQGKTYVQAVMYIAHKYGVEISDIVNKDYVKPLPRLETISEKAIAWFEKRGISNNTIIRFKLTSSIEWMPQTQKEESVICFNYFRDEELVNIKFRDGAKNFKLNKDSERIFYNLDAVKGCDEIVIVEGEVDCMSFHEAGVYNSVSVPNGASKGKQNLDYLDNCYQYFLGAKKLIIAVDNDEPGKLLKEELARRLGKERVFLVDWPEGCKDANDVLVKFGGKILKEIYQNARLYPLEGELTIDDMGETLLDYYSNGYPPGYPAGIPGFDEYLTFYPGQLTMVTGIPGSGKDEFVNYICEGLARNHGWKFGVIGFEEPSEITVTKIIEKHSGKSFGFRKDLNHRMTQVQFEKGLLFVHEHFKFINTDEIEVTIDGLVNKAQELVTRYGINGLIISPWNCIEHKIPHGYSETQYVSEVLQKLIVFLKKRGVHCFLIAHPTKIERDKKTGKYEVTTLYKISGSAHFFNKTYNGISVYRDFETGQVDVYIQKVKWSWLGKIGSCSFTFDTMTRQYIPIKSM